MHTIRTSSALQGYTSFPYALQVFSIDRQTTNLGEKSLRRETAYGVTRLSPQQAGPERLLQLVRGHRKTENRVHWVRDVTFDADRSQVRTCAGRRTLTSLRNLAISLFRLRGCTNISRALCSCAWDYSAAPALMGVPTQKLSQVTA